LLNFSTRKRNLVYFYVPNSLLYDFLSLERETKRTNLKGVFLQTMRMLQGWSHQCHHLFYQIYSKEMFLLTGQKRAREALVWWERNSRKRHLKSGRQLGEKIYSRNQQLKYLVLSP